MGHTCPSTFPNEQTSIFKSELNDIKFRAEVTLTQKGEESRTGEAKSKAINEKFYLLFWFA